MQFWLKESFLIIIVPLVILVALVVLFQSLIQMTKTPIIFSCAKVETIKRVGGSQKNNNKMLANCYWPTSTNLFLTFFPYKIDKNSFNVIFKKGI